LVSLLVCLIEVIDKDPGIHSWEHHAGWLQKFSSLEQDIISSTLVIA
jgi:hypothetical protein